LTLSARSTLAKLTLEGWESCGSREAQIADAWQQSWEILDATRGKTVDWNEAAALEYLGPPAYNQNKQAAIQGSAAFSLLSNRLTWTDRGLCLPETVLY
jgi:hypothetical protein